MKSLVLLVGLFVAAFMVTTACLQKKHSQIMTFRELYDDNDVELEQILND